MVNSLGRPSEGDRKVGIGRSFGWVKRLTAWLMKFLISCPKLVNLFEDWSFGCGGGSLVLPFPGPWIGPSGWMARWVWVWGDLAILRSHFGKALSGGLGWWG